MLSPNAPIVLGAILGSLVVFILILVVILRKRVKDEASLNDAIPTRRTSSKVKDGQPKAKRGRKKAGTTENEVVEVAESEESFLFDSEEINIVPQGVRNLTQTSAPWNFAIQDKDRFGTAAGTVPAELAQPVVTPPVSSPAHAAPPVDQPEIEQQEQPVNNLPMTRRARRAIDWD